MGTNLSLDVVRHLLWYEGDTNLGRDGGHAFANLVRYIKSADNDAREWVSERHPEVVTGVLLLMRTHWALEWMRGLVKRAEDGLPLGDELDMLTTPTPFAPVPASGHVCLAIRMELVG